MTDRMAPFEYNALWRAFGRKPALFQGVFPHHAEYTDLLQGSEKLAYLIRSYSVYQMTCGTLGHPGGSFSEGEFLAVLFEYALRFDPSKPGCVPSPRANVRELSA